MPLNLESRCQSFQRETFCCRYERQEVADLKSRLLGMMEIAQRDRSWTPLYIFLIKCRCAVGLCIGQNPQSLISLHLFSPTASTLASSLTDPAHRDNHENGRHSSLFPLHSTQHLPPNFSLSLYTAMAHTDSPLGLAFKVLSTPESSLAILAKIRTILLITRVGPRTTAWEQCIPGHLGLLSTPGQNWNI